MAFSVSWSTGDRWRDYRVRLDLHCHAVLGFDWDDASVLYPDEAEAIMTEEFDALIARRLART